MWWLTWLACIEPGPGDVPPADEIRRDAERRMVHGTELALLWRTATDALREDRPAAAAAAIALGMEVDRSRFEPLLERLAESEDPQALSILAARVDRGRFRERAERTEVDRRYARGALGETLERYDGVDRRRGQRVLAAVDAEYVVEPDLARMTDAVGVRFRQLSESAAVRSAFPRWSGERDGADVMGRIDGAVTAGLPEEIAVGEGIGAALGALDPYTMPVWPAALMAWEEHHAGSYVGVGVDLLDHAAGVYVGLPLVGGPAWEAGVHAGDRIVGVAGETTEGLDSHGVGDRLRGEAGTAVGVEVEREGVALTFEMTRASIREETVSGFRRTAAGWDPWIAPGIALLRISAFRPHTDEELDALVPSEPPAVVLLDLRGNGGGDVMAAVNVADRFVAHGDVAHLEGRTLSSPDVGPNGEVPWNVALPGHPLEHRPVVVLVDRDTASAAELVAGALRELAEAKLVGEQTYGKGLSQALRVDTELGVGWQVTDGAWLLPSRRALEAPGGERTGLVPDVVLALSPAERLQVRAMRRTRELPPVHPDGTQVPDLGTVARSELPRLSDDPQLEEALRIARSLQ
jgi:carboxyl-terminal processing protease